MFKQIFVILIICVINSQCVSLQEEVRNSTKFTLDWYHSSFNETENFAVSPISFRILLSLLYQSTLGDTEQELQENVYLSDKDETAESQRLSLNRLIENPNIKVVNRMYVKTDYVLRESFLAKASEYHSGIEEKDFMKSEQTANEINQFVEEQTNGLIKDLVSKDLFDEDTRLLLLNTLYFKADWQLKFNENDVFKSEFHGIDGQRYSIDFMNNQQQHYCYHSKALKASILKLNYVEESHSKFIIILPDENSNLIEVNTKLNTETLNEIFTNQQKRTLKVSMPQFELESSIDGTKVLKSLGLNSMFFKKEIDLSETGPKLVVSDAKQKTKIIVNSKGTEAASGTYIAVSVFRSSVQQLIVNRPFIFLIVTDEPNEILFIGHYTQPSHEFLVL